MSSMDGITNAAYISGKLVSLIALCIHFSLTAIGLASSLFNPPPVFTLENNLHRLLSMSDFIIATVIGSIIAIGFTFYITIKYSQQICAFVFKYIPHEAILGLFFSLVLILSFMDVVCIIICGILLISLFAVILHLCVVYYGV